MIEIEDLSFSPGPGFRLDVPQLGIAPRSRTAVVGPSGTGKTTLLNLLSGILVPDSGRVVVAGTEVHRLNDAARRAFRAREIGFVFQNFALIEYLSAFENILYPARVAAGLRADAALRARARELGERVGLGARLGDKPAQLSQGEQQRIAICRALVMQPALVLADEATGNLDPENKGLILDLLFEEVGHAGATLIAVTHDHQLLERFDQVVDFSRFRGTA